MEVSVAVLFHIACQGFDPLHGARLICRYIQRWRRRLCGVLIRGGIADGAMVRVNFVSEEVSMEFDEDGEKDRDGDALGSAV